MSEKLYPCLRESDNLDMRLKEINSFNNSIQNIKDIQNFYNHEAKKYKKKSKQYKLINCLIQSIDGVSVLAVSSTCVTLSVTGVGLVVVPIASGIGAGLCIISKIAGEYLKRKEQQNIKNYTLAGRTLHDYQKLHSKCLEDNKIDLNEYNKLKQTYDLYKTNKSKLSSEFFFRINLFSKNKISIKFKS